jgi:hypothetical protein
LNTLTDLKNILNQSIKKINKIATCGILAVKGKEYD